MFSNETKKIENLPDVTLDELYISMAKDAPILRKDEDEKIEKERDTMLLVKWQPLYPHPLPVSEEKFLNDRLLRRLSYLKPDQRILMAASEGLHWVVEEFYIRGCPLDVKNDQGYTPLHLAAGFGHTKVVRVLLNMGVDVNAQTLTGYTPLYLAKSGGHEEIAAMISEKGGLHEVKKPHHPSYMSIFDIDLPRPENRVIDAQAKNLERPVYPTEL
mmetsp:Transcript_12742/g.16750  ORF Transcript_12742/g.16750 Transcript_12742/m.16750 type:complete len:215 (-) Transcript_12742:249-893(-)|eukprot:CAMPEP_0117751912 /NCGR_PEP_ID=MMETSP0947-20121206/11269_1 /TAXON_ID=44440 /ORGANISM="Chattonella subsalsa, Strain CCMP2191" /LENGTH=214 /DNA_ID=CAMNT_0005570407 /DNA_START=254 /DNA_END=898 /DNA_ORIENTATION=+